MIIWMILAPITVTSLVLTNPRCGAARLCPSRPAYLARTWWYGMCSSYCAGTKGGLRSFLMRVHFYRFSAGLPPLCHWTDGAAKPFALSEIPHLSATTPAQRPPTPPLKRDNAGRPGARVGALGVGTGGPTRYLISVSNTEATGSRTNPKEMKCPMWGGFLKQKLSNH